jgi:hypothetical protein
MKKIRTKIFSKNILIDIKYENRTIVEALEEQFSYYDSFSENENVDLTINIVNSFSHLKVIQRNPSIHSEIRGGFIAELGNFKAAFYKTENQLVCELFIQPSGNRFFSFLRKVNNIEFATREERVAQILFESILIPSLFFDNEKIVVHSSGFVKNDKAILVGGTGGSGKTSLELELCLNKGFSFINDDIAVVNKDAKVLPNLAHPKIYGYNLQNNKTLKEKLLNGKSILDIAQWHIKSKLLGSSKVRRRLFIRNNFAYTNKSVKLSKYFILMKEDVKEISIEKITSEKATQLHLDVIFAEYSHFLNNIYWHEFNCLASNREPILTPSELRLNWERNSKAILSQLDSYIVRIPLQVEHKDFLKKVSNLIAETK